MTAKVDDRKSKKRDLLSNRRNLAFKDYSYIQAYEVLFLFPDKQGDQIFGLDEGQVALNVGQYLNNPLWAVSDNGQQ